MYTSISISEASSEVLCPSQAWPLSQSKGWFFFYCQSVTPRMQRTCLQTHPLPNLWQRHGLQPWNRKTWVLWVIPRGINLLIVRTQSWSGIGREVWFKEKPLMVNSENQMWEESHQGQGEKSYCLRKHFSPKEKVSVKVVAR